jgi:subfamily B ATP-binding cassette protein MsbA
MLFRDRAIFYRRAMVYFRPDAPLVVGWTLCLAVASAIGLLMAWPFAVLVDSVFTSNPHLDSIHRLFLRPLPTSRLGQLIGLAIISLLLKFSQDLLGAMQTLISNQINYAGTMRVRCDLFRKLQALSISYHQNQPQGDAIYRLSNDTQGCQMILGVIVSSVLAALTLVVITTVLASKNVPLMLTAFSITPLLAWANFVFAKRFNRRTVQCREMDSKLTTNVQRSLGSIRLVQAFAREQQEFEQYHASIREAILAWWALNREQISYNLIVGTLFGLGGAAIFGLGGFLVLRGKLSVGDLIVFNSYLAMLWGPLCQLTGFSASIQDGVAATRRVFEVLDRDPIVSDPLHPVALHQRPSRLELDHITFAYEPQRPILKDISIAIEPGQLVAFVGASGAGKSTLLNLLPRFFDPTGGQVRIDGIDARQLQLKDLRRNIALVLQDTIILPTTVAENIAYGRPMATRQQIIHAAELAGAAAFISDLQNGFDTPLAEGGANLSGGQRQRLAIAQALLTEAPFIVLDEPTSALDTHHEQLITETLNSLRGRRTIIVVTHRLSSVRGCDQIFVLDKGSVVQHGTHAQLSQLPGRYRQMLQHDYPTTALAA